MANLGQEGRRLIELPDVNLDGIGTHELSCHDHVGSIFILERLELILAPIDADFMVVLMPKIMVIIDQKHFRLSAMDETHKPAGILMAGEEDVDSVVPNVFFHEGVKS